MKYLRLYKGKILIALLSFVVFLFIIFPYSETSDLISSLVTEGSQNQVLFRFQDLELGVSPHFGLQFSQTHLKIAGLGAVDPEQIVVSPSISSLFSQIPYGSVSTRGAFGRGSQLDLQMRAGSKSEAGTDRQRIELHASQISLEDLKEFADLPLLVKGSTNLELRAQFDMLLAESPEADFQLEAD